MTHAEYARGYTDATIRMLEHLVHYPFPSRHAFVMEVLDTAAHYDREGRADKRAKDLDEALGLREGREKLDAWWKRYHEKMAKAKADTSDKITMVDVIIRSMREEAVAHVKAFQDANPNATREEVQACVDKWFKDNAVGKTRPSDLGIKASPQL